MTSQQLKRLGYWSVMCYFIIAILYPTIRVLLMGSRTATNPFEILFSIIPDLTLLTTFSIAFLYINKFETTWWKQFTYVDKAIAAFLLVNVIYGFIVGGDFRLAAYSIRLTYLPVLFYFSARWLHENNSRQDFDKFFQALVIGSTIIGLVMYFFFHEAITWMMERGNYFESVYFVSRLTSIFWNPIMYASLAGFGVLYYFSNYLQSGKVNFLLLMNLILFTLLLTISRGAIWSCLMASVIVMIITKRWKRAGIVYLQIAIVFAIAWSVPFLREVIVWFLESTAKTVDAEGGVSRVILWQRSWNDFVEQPFGYGLGKAGHVAHRFLLGSNIKAAVWSTDGWYLKMANETGIIGLVTIAVLFVTTLLFFLKQLTAFRSIQSTWLIGAVVFTMIQCIVSNVLDFFFIAPLFWFLFGLLVNETLNERTKT